MNSILITGASSGIGQATAIKLASLGYHVIIHGRTLESLTKTKQLLQEEKASFSAYAYDINNTKAMKESMIQIKQEFGRLDGLVNNAGVMKEALFALTNEDLLNETFDTNVKSLYYQTQYAVKLMRKSSSPSIVNVASIAGVEGVIGSSAYSASKAAVIGLTKSLSKELALQNIRVNAVAPGFVDTALIKDYDMLKREKIINNISLKRIGNPQDVANTIAFLLSQEASYITGQVIGVDGGMVI